MQQQKPPEWRALQVRYTLFFAKRPSLSDAEAWWASVVSEKPDLEESKPREQTRKLAGAFGKNRLELEVALSRVDWRLNAGVWDETRIAQSIGPFEAALKEFQAGLKPWLATANFNVTRIAVGTILDWPAKTREETYQVLQRFLPFVQLDPVKMINFMLQLNIRGRLKSGEEFNRLTKWHSVNIQALPEGAAPGVTPLEENYARAELDINTLAENQREIDPAETRAILNELQASALELAEHGLKP